ncbi:MAG: hypothetical protein KQH63_14630 [Desulfobulbaceae bacterium]|nr:hypothetical protein [Desulfobulbaceae bacterium]
MGFLEDPPQSINLSFSLLRDGMTVKSSSATLNPRWGLVMKGTTTATVNYIFDLPESGTGSTQMSSNANYTGKARILIAKFEYIDGFSAPFAYTIFSGNLFFNQVLTQLGSLSPGAVCTGGDFTIDSPSSATWNSGHGSILFDPSGICALESDSADGYTTDLSVVSGTVGMGTLTGETAGLAWALYSLSLDSQGGHYAYAAHLLPDDVTAHVINQNQVWPRGWQTISILTPGSFSQSVGDIVLSRTESLFFHSYKLPFYVAADSMSLSLSAGNIQGIVLSNPTPYYVHQDAFTSLPAGHRRSYFGFASNDAMFREGDNDPFHLNTIHMNADGMNGHLEFEANACDTAFPKAHLEHPTYGIDIVDGAFADNSTLTGSNPVYFAMFFDGNCQDGACGETSTQKSYRLASENGATFFANGALAGRFDNLGDPRFSTSSELSWGGSTGTDGTFFRHDMDKPGVWVVPGFIMPDTAATPTSESASRIGQTLLASFTFEEPPADAPIVADSMHQLNDPSDYAAYWGDGYFAGINMGPEFLNGPYSGVQTVDSGVGEILDAGLSVRFNGNSSFADMADRRATKYNLRLGGLTGVFNTGFSGADSGNINIYGYDINFSRFSFRQTLNRLSPETFIDGELTLPPPVGDADGLRVGFTKLALTCNGNLGGGTLDNEPEPTWPNGSAPTGCDGEKGDEDTYIDEGCHVLGYWNMPMLMTGMSFENDPDSATSSGDCNTRPRVLQLNTMNVVEKLGSPLTMSAVYTHDGLLRNQDIYGTVDTWFDRPDGESSQPGFNLRLADAYLNEITDPANLPAWQGFTVLSGHVDVPLFNDAKLKGHFVNGSGSQAVYMMEDDADDDHDGISASFDTNDADAAAGSVNDFRDLLAPSPDTSGAAPKPLFEYYWPRQGVIDLVYRADYQPAAANTMANFAGIKKTGTALAGVLEVDSVPDYINPLRTKFSFGVSANTAELANLSIDVGGITDGLNDFLHSQLGVDLSFDLEGMLAELTQAEQYMHDITGGDITQVLGEVVDEALQEGLNQGGMADFIRAAANGLNEAHQAPYMVSSILTEPFTAMQEEIVDLLDNPDLDFAALAVDLNSASELQDALAPFLIYDADDLRVLYEDFTGVVDDPEFDDLLARFQNLQNGVDDLKTKLAIVKDAKNNAVNFLNNTTGAATTDIDVIIDLAITASDRVHNLYNELTVGLGNYTTATESNELLGKLDEAKDGVRAVKNAIESVHLGDIADALYIASLVAGSPMDVSMLHSAEDTANNAVNQLDQIISDAEQNLTALLMSLPLADILATLDGFLGDSGLIQQSLRGAPYGDPPAGGLISSLEDIKTSLPTTLDFLAADLDRIDRIVDSLAPHSPKIIDVPSWHDAVESAQADLDSTIGGIYIEIQATGEIANSLLFIELYNLPEINFTTVFGDPAVREKILTTPLQYIVTNSSLQGDLQNMVDNVVSLLPNPSEEDIRKMIRSAILNTDQIEAMNRIFFEQFGFVSDMVDDVSTMLAHQINTMIREAIANLNDSTLQDALDSITADIGSDWGVASAGIDGYAIVSQDEIERLHLEAEFSFEGEPDPTSYNAALDIATWNSNNERSGCTDGGDGNIDVVISTHDVTADMLGMDVGLKEALLGFTMQTEPVLPIGVFGRVYLQGELGFESMALYDLGLEAAFGAVELYFGAKGAARFSDYTIPMAAFYLGTSCGENNVLERLDPEVAEFIGPINPLTGVYVRGSVEVPVWNNGCALTVGVGADVGAWYFTLPEPGTFGGLLGGSAYGQLACLASLKGSMTLIGQKSGSAYSFAGSGWGAAGVGYCSPSKWKSVRDARKDDWCLTGEATFGVTYVNSDWNFNGPDVSCCH